MEIDDRALIHDRSSSRGVDHSWFIRSSSADDADGADKAHGSIEYSYPPISPISAEHLHSAAHLYNE
jgi:hypothetical protein